MTRKEALLQLYKNFSALTMEDHAGAFAMIVKSGLDRGLGFDNFRAALDGFEKQVAERKNKLN